MTKYICDRCGKQLVHRDDPKGGAHRLKVKDVIPWSENTVMLSEFEKDLCGPCFKELRTFLEPLAEAAP